MLCEGFVNAANKPEDKEIPLKSRYSLIFFLFATLNELEV